jgi:hypothetical protein
MFSQLTRYASEFAVQIDRAELDIRIEYRGLGKMMVNEDSPAAQRVTYQWEIDSPSPRERISEMLAWIEKGCHTVNSLRQPIPVTGSLQLNGADLPFASRPFPVHPDAPSTEGGSAP